MEKNQDFIIKIFLIGLLSLQTLLTEAQVTITGTVLDESGMPLPSATVLLLNPSDTFMVKGGYHRRFR